VNRRYQAGLYWFVILLLLIPVLHLTAQEALERGKQLLLRATDSFFDHSLTSGELRGLLDSGRTAFVSIADPCLRAYWLARTEYLSGFVERDAKKEKEAERRFRAGYELAERAAACPGLADALRLQADLIAQLIPSHGALYAMANGPRIRTLAEKALALEPVNAKARLTLALFYQNAPAVAGGDAGRALRLLNDLERDSPSEREDRFAVLTWLGLAYRSRKDQARARQYFQRALEVYPGNTWIRELMGAG
jgi:tetratricopeptide (TPR) repeat protein